MKIPNKIEGIVSTITYTDALDFERPSDELYKSYNESLELKCMIKQHLEAESEKSIGCPVDFDSILCWPRTNPNTYAVLSCLENFKGVHYDNTKNATRFCDLYGRWDNYTNYDQCSHVAQPSPVSEFELIVELPTLIYYVGYTISLIALLLAVSVFIYFKDLRCLRNTIHANLFLTYIMSGLMWMLTLSLQINLRPGVVGCILLVTFLHYFSLTNFFWMMVEGIYLYMLVIETFSGESLGFNSYALIGWGGPSVFVIIWAIVKSLSSRSEYIDNNSEIECTWLKESQIDWIYQGPACAVLIINLIFLLQIMWVLITKLRSANSPETKQYRKASKALLVLIPLLGITYLLVLTGPERGFSSHVFAIIRAVLLSSQGVMVSLFYCFLNSEVRCAVRHQMSVWRDKRNIRYRKSGRNKRCTSSTYSHSRDYSPRSRTESIRPFASYGKRESSASSATTTTLLGSTSYYPRDSNGVLCVALTPRATSPFIQQNLDENYV